jgi:hypothetical protein
MKSVLYLLALFLICLVGCSPNDSAKKKEQTMSADKKEQTMKVKEFTESDACKALLKDLACPVDSPLGKALLAERFVRERHSGDCIIETEEEGQLSFNLKKKTFTIVHGINAKTGAPYEIWGEFFVSESGELKARFTGQAD